MYETADASMKMRQTAGGLAGPASLGQSIAPKQTAMQEHAHRLHQLAANLSNCNARLGSILDRLHGPTPEATGNGEKNPDPTGALYIAQFGAERISIEIDRLNQLCNRLEQVA